MTSHGFQICTICGIYQFQCCKFSGSSFTDGLQNTMMTSLWRHFIILGFKISKLYETGYKLWTCQVLNPSVIWIKFYRDFHRTPQNSLWRHYDVTLKYLAFKIAHFVKLNERHQPGKFHLPRLSGSNFTRTGGSPPKTYMLSKSPVLIGLKLNLAFRPFNV